MNQIKAIFKGGKDVVAKLQAKDKAYQDALSKAMAVAGLMLQAYSQAIVPVDFGLLKNSAYTRVTGSGANTRVQIGYTASYALWVHERLSPKVTHGAEWNTKHAADLALKPKSGPFRHTRGPDQQAQFLTKPIQEHKQEFVDLIADMMRRA